MSDIRSNIKVSVIVPVYNVEKYVEECILSIIHQTLREIEIIVVNDGSTDSSLDICRRLAEQDKRIILVTQENKGLGEARNYGMSFARGEYLSFVDSDDYIEAEYLEYLYKRAVETGVDVVKGKLSRYYESTGEYIDASSCDNDIQIHLDNETFESFLFEYYYTNRYTPYGCDKLYNKRFLDNINAKFGDNKRIFAEDVWFQLQVLHADPVISFCDSPKYIYRQRSTSIMNSPKKDVMKRQMTAVKDYISMISHDRKHAAEESIADLLAEEALTQAVLNQVRFGGNRRDFFAETCSLLNDKTLVTRVINLYTVKSYRFIKRRGRRYFVYAVGFLFYIHQYKAACMLYWVVYKLIYSTVRLEK